MLLGSRHGAPCLFFVPVLLLGRWCVYVYAAPALVLGFVFSVVVRAVRARTMRCAAPPCSGVSRPLRPTKSNLVFGTSACWNQGYVLTPHRRRTLHARPALPRRRLWQLLSKIDGPPSLLDPLAAVLSWFFLELLMVSVPRGVWSTWDIGARGGAAAAAGDGVPRLMMPGSVPEEGERENEEDAAFSLPWGGTRRARAGGAPQAVGSLLPSNGGRSGGRPSVPGVGSGDQAVAPAAPSPAASFEEVAPATVSYGAAAMSEPGPRSSGGRHRNYLRAASVKQGTAAVRAGGATPAGTSRAGVIGEGQGSVGTRNRGEEAAATATVVPATEADTGNATAAAATARSQRERRRVVIVDAAAAAAAAPASPAAGASSPRAGESAARIGKRRPRTVASAAAAAATADTTTTPARSTDRQMESSPSTTESVRSTETNTATPSPQLQPGDSRGSGKRALPSGGYNSVGGARSSKRRHRVSGGGRAGGGWWSSSHGGYGSSPAGESPAAKRAMMMKTRGLSVGSARGSVVFGGLGDGFGDAFADFEDGLEELQQQSRGSQPQQDRQPPQGQDDNGGGGCDGQGKQQPRALHQGQQQQLEQQREQRLEHKPSSESHEDRATPAAAAAAAANGTPTGTAAEAERDARISHRAAPASCASSRCSTSSTVATKAPSSTSSSSEASPAPAPALAPTPPADVVVAAVAAVGTGSDGKASNRGMTSERPTEPRGRGQRTEPEAGSGSGSGSSSTSSAREAGWDNRDTLVALYESARDSSGGEAGERGTPVPPELRPPGREMDVLCEWRLEQLRVDDEVGMFSRGTFGTFRCLLLEALVRGRKRGPWRSLIVSCVFSSKNSQWLFCGWSFLVALCDDFRRWLVLCCSSCRATGGPGACISWCYA